MPKSETPRSAEIYPDWVVRNLGDTHKMGKMVVGRFRANGENDSEREESFWVGSSLEIMVTKDGSDYEIQVSVPFMSQDHQGVIWFKGEVSPGSRDVRVQRESFEKWIARAKDVEENLDRRQIGIEVLKTFMGLSNFGEAMKNMLFEVYGRNQDTAKFDTWWPELKSDRRLKFPNREMWLEFEELRPSEFRQRLGSGVFIGDPVILLLNSESLGN